MNWRVADLFVAAFATTFPVRNAEAVTRPDGAVATLLNSDGTLTSWYKDRCNISYGDLTPRECAESREMAYNNGEGCLSLDEYWQSGQAALYTQCMSLRGKTDRLGTACPCSCFEGDVKILAASSPHTKPEWIRARDFTEDNAAVTLADDSRHNALGFVQRKTFYTTKGPEEAPLFVIQTKDGRELALTQHHALLLADGRITHARDLKTSDKLMDQEGSAIEIADITRRKTHEDVYNFLTRSETKQGHLVIAEGLIVGDLAWQNMLDEESTAFDLRN